MLPERLYGRIAPTIHTAIERLGWHASTLEAPILARHERLDLGWGLRIVLAADLHVDEHFFPRERVRQVVELINDLDDVDAVVMPGDFVGHDVHAIDWAAEELSGLDAPAFATLGNHDHMEGPDHVASALEDAGVDVITDRAFEFGPVWLAGVESRYVHEPAAGAIDAMVPDGVECVVIGHEPSLAMHHTQRLHLAGHTHHGQVRIPGFGWRLSPSHCGPFTEAHTVLPGPDGERHVYITGGLGCTTVPIRIGVPAEIVVLDL